MTACFSGLAWRCVLASAIALTAPGWGRAEPDSGDAHVFENRGGQKLVARFIEAKAGFVKLARIPDGKPLVLEIAKLRPADQAWIEQRIAMGAGKKEEIHVQAASWRLLHVQLPNPFDEAAVLGVDGGHRLPVRGCEQVFTTPKGSWIALYISAEDRILTHLVPYDGAGNWEISREGWRVILRSDGGQPRMVGITWAQGVDLASLLRHQAGVVPADEISLELRDPAQLQQLAAIARRTGAIITRKLRLGRDALGQIANAEPRAFLGYLKEADLDVLGEMSRVEALSLFLTDVPIRDRGNGRFGVNPLPFPRIPTLRSLFIQTPALPDDLLKT